MASLAVASEQERLRLDSELAALENERTRALDAFEHRLRGAREPRE